MRRSEQTFNDDLNLNSGKLLDTENIANILETDVITVITWIQSRYLPANYSSTDKKYYIHPTQLLAWIRGEKEQNREYVKGARWCIEVEENTRPFL